MPDDITSSDAPSGPADHTAPGPKPLGRNASRTLVIGSILFVLAVAAGGTWLILDLARSAPPPQEVVSPADTSDTAAAPAP